MVKIYNIFIDTIQTITDWFCEKHAKIKGWFFLWITMKAGDLLSDSTTAEYLAYELYGTYRDWESYYMEKNGEVANDVDDDVEENEELSKEDSVIEEWDDMYDA